MIATPTKTPTFTSYEQAVNSPLIVGITDTGQRVGFESIDQFNQYSGGKATINQVPTAGGAIPFSTWSSIMGFDQAAPAVAAPQNGAPVAPLPAGGTPLPGSPLPAPQPIDPAVERENAAKEANLQAKRLYDQIDQRAVETRQSSQVIANALKSIQGERSSIASALSNALAPSREEQAARARLNAIVQEGRGLNVKTTAANMKLDSHNLPDDVIRGFKQELAKDVQLKFQTLGIQEQAAVDSVRMYQEDRNQRIQQYQFLLSENNARFDQTLGIFDLMRSIQSEQRAEDRADRSEARSIQREAKEDIRYSEEKEYNRAQDKKQEMRQQLMDIMTFSEGKSWNELDGASQTAIKEAAQANGLSEQMLRNALGAPNRQWAEEMGVTEAFYLSPDGRTVIERKTGEAVDFNEYVRRGGRGDFTDVQKIDANTIQEKQEVSQLRLNYWDAGITMKDTLEQAAAKVKANSQIWRNEQPKARGSSSNRGNGSDEEDDMPYLPTEWTPSNVKGYLKAMKKTFGDDNPYWEVWGAAADEIRAAGKNPEDYDEQMWEVFRPGETKE